MHQQESSKDTLPITGNLHDMVYAESEIGQYNHLNGTSRGSSMHSEDWQFDDHDIRSEGGHSALSYATSVYSEVTDSTINSQPDGKKTKRFKKINPAHALSQVDELSKARGSVQRNANDILPLDKQDTLQQIRTNLPPNDVPSLFAKESFGPEKLQKKLSLGGELSKQISQSKIRESMEMDPSLLSMSDQPSSPQSD